MQAQQVEGVRPDGELVAAHERNRQQRIKRGQLLSRNRRVGLHLINVVAARFGSLTRIDSAYKKAVALGRGPHPTRVYAERGQ